LQRFSSGLNPYDRRINPPSEASEGWLLSTAMKPVLLFLLQQVSEDSLAQ